MHSAAALGGAGVPGVGVPGVGVPRVGVGGEFDNGYLLEATEWRTVRPRTGLTNWNDIFSLVV